MNRSGSAKGAGITLPTRRGSLFRILVPPRMMPGASFISIRLTTSLLVMRLHSREKTHARRTLGAALPASAGGVNATQRSERLVIPVFFVLGLTR